MVVARKPAEAVENSTPEWRKRVRNEIEARGRGTASRLAEDLKISTGQLSETINESKDQPATRFSRYKRAIDEWLWPPLLPPAADTHEIRYLLDGLVDANRDLLRLIKDMGPAEQRKLAEAIAAMRGSRK